MSILNFSRRISTFFIVYPERSEGSLKNERDVSAKAQHDVNQRHTSLAKAHSGHDNMETLRFAQSDSKKASK